MPAPDSATPLIRMIGGPRGLVDSGLPTVAFATVAALATLHHAVLAAVLVALALAAFRLLHHEPLRYAAAGLAGVTLSAIVAVRLGNSAGFFLPGILTNLGYAVGCAWSIALRRPLVGLLAGALGHPVVGPRGRRMAVWTTAGWGLVFAARAGVQGVLFLAGLTGWLAVARLAMGWPLTLAALAATVVAFRTAGPEPSEPAQNSVSRVESAPRSAS